MFLRLDVLAVAISFLGSSVQSTPTPVHKEVSRRAELVKRATCTPTSAGDSGTDDVPSITAAITSCGDGGVIEIPAGTQFAINSVLDFTGCVDCTFNVEGTLKASDDLDFWEGKTAIIYMDNIAKATFQSVTGTGVIDGNGQAAYDYFAQNSSYARPTLHYITGTSSGITVQGLTVKNPPNVFFSATTDTTDIAFASLTMTAASTSTYAAKNTDGFDIGGSYITLNDITVSNQDDCIAFKNGANYVSVDTISCTGSHGLSVGSLGSKAGEVDSVTNVYVTGATMSDGAKAVGIKLYPGGSDYGSSIVSNVTWNDVNVDGSEYAFEIQSCYDGDADYCADNPSNATLTDINITNFSGTTSDDYAPVTSNIDCNITGDCDLTFTGWEVETTSGTAEVLCDNVSSDAGITCTDGATG